MPAVTADRKLAVFVESRQLAWDGAGQLAAVEMRRNLHSYRTLTRDQRWLYHSPYPLPDGRILVSRRPADDKGTHGIYRLDPSSGETERIFDSAQHHDLQARFQVSRAEPDGRSSIVAESEPDGRLYCLNVYQSDWSRPEWLPPGSVVRLRVLEGVPRKLTASRESGTLSEPPLLQKRILGEIPIEQDGSFFIQIPANTPVQLQTLDERGLALQTCGWIWSRNNEPRGCIGCHEDGELTPTNRLVEAVKKPPLQLTLPPARRRVVDFRRDVAPILAGPCSSPSCHGAQGVQPGLLPETNQAASPIEADGWKPVYESLLGKLQGGRGRSDSEQCIRPGEARNSPLIWHLFGENTSRPWDELGGQPKVDVSAQLTDEQRKVFVEWIDLGALWDGIPQAAPAGHRVPSHPEGRLGGKK
jgi:hypothetical protein